MESTGICHRPVLTGDATCVRTENPTGTCARHISFSRFGDVTDAARRAQAADHTHAGVSVSAERVRTSWITLCFLLLASPKNTVRNTHDVRSLSPPTA